MTEITTPCLVCATKGRAGSEFFATRGTDWPTTEVAGHQVHRACASDAEHLARTVADGGLAIDAGVARWTSNDRAVPDDCAALLAALGLAPGIDLAATAAANRAGMLEALAAYRAAQPPEPSAEELAEMRAAFGPGQRIVDVLTGREVTT